MITCRNVHAQEADSTNFQKIAHTHITNTQIQKQQHLPESSHPTFSCFSWPYSLGGLNSLHPILHFMLSSSSQLQAGLPAREHMAKSEDICGCHNLVR